MIHRIRSGSLHAAFAAASIVAGAAGTRAATVHVPGDRSTIQAGILAASPGDTVLVAPGSYRELIHVKNGIVLRSVAGPDSTTLITPGLETDLLKERLMEFDAGVDRSTVIEGFTMDAQGLRGAAVYCDSASPTIRGNVIRNFGWGVFLTNGSDALLDDNVIMGGRSFGVLIRASSPELRRNTITDNEPRGISISGRRSKPVIGGRPEYANHIYGQTCGITNESVNDIDATCNDWGWATLVEMEQQPYPADIRVITDGNDRGSSHRGRGAVDYRNWVRPKPGTPSAAGGPVAPGTGAGTAPDTVSAAGTGGAEPPAESAPAVADAPAGGGKPRWTLPILLGLGLVALFVILSRRKA